MALIADQINVGPVEPLPVVKSDLQRIRESLAEPADVMVINNLSYKIGVIDPFKVKKKRSIEELILINEVSLSNLEASQENTVDEEDLLTLKQAREIARLEHELQQLNEYKAALDAAVVPELVQEIVKPDLLPDWTIIEKQRVVLTS